MCGLVVYYQVPNNSDGRNNSDGWKGAWILIIAMAGIIALGGKSFNFNNSDCLNDSNGWKKHSMDKPVKICKGWFRSIKAYH